jgi:exonuclease SbcC
MSKIKSIKISDFRIYQDTQTFSFERNTQLSNLMIIYAPNGFGKTSFFDAIEWCYANKIRRFDNDVINDEIERRDYSSGDKILLTNRKSHKQGKKGSVVINTIDGHEVKRVVKIRKSTGEDFKYDYKPGGELTTDLDDELLLKLIKTNILTQDQIDAFLRYTKPEDKFTALKEFWSEGDSATSTLRQIDSYDSMITLELATVEKDRQKLQEQLDDLLKSVSNIDVVNELISGLLKTTVTGFKVDLVTADVNEDLYNSISEVTQSYIIRANNLRDATQTKVLKLKSLQDAYENFVVNLNAKPIITLELNALVELANLYLEIKSLRKNLTEKGDDLAIANKVIDNLNKLLAVIEDVVKLNSTIAHQRNLISELYTENDRLLNMKQTFLQSAQVIGNSINTAADLVKQLEEKLNSWDNNITSYQYWTAEVQKQEAAKLKLIPEIKTVDDKITLQLERTNYLSAMFRVSDFQNLNEADRTNLRQQLDRQTSLNHSLAATRSRITAVKLEIDRSVSLDETFDKLIVWGEEYVKNADANHCPLCATEFADVNTLLTSITQQKSGNSLTINWQTNLNLLLQDEKDLAAQLDAVIASINLYLNTEIEVCNSSLSALQNEKSKLSNDEKDIDNAINHAKLSSNRFFDSLQGESIQADLADDLDAVKLSLTERLSEAQLKSDRLKAILAGKILLSQGVENQVSVNRNKVITAENTIELSNADPDMITANNLIETLKLSEQDFNTSSLQNLLQLQTITRQENQTTIDGFEKKVSDVQSRITAHGIQIPEQEIPARTLDQQNRLADVDRITTSYLNLYKAQIATEAVNKKDLDDLTVEQETLVPKIDREISALTDLSIKLELIEKNVTKNRIEKDIAELINRLPQLTAAQEEIRTAKQTAKVYIDQEINNYFNKDVINQIYSRIEPHPDLNMIDFVPEVTDKGPIITVKAVSHEDDLNPVLYLSAGQLNVLSLSIFLAKAFEMGEGLISTIFMDDPIQNLSDINVLSFIDLIRTMITTFDKQIVISTHDENFYKLMRHKMPSDAFNVVYYEMQSFGKAQLAETR